MCIYDIKEICYNKVTGRQWRILAIYTVSTKKSNPLDNVR